jgi:hypothetical protein
MTKQRRYNSTYKKLVAQCSTDTFMVAENLVLRINIYGENPAHRKSENN